MSAPMPGPGRRFCAFFLLLLANAGGSEDSTAGSAALVLSAAGRSCDFPRPPLNLFVLTEEDGNSDQGCCFGHMLAADESGGENDLLMLLQTSSDVAPRRRSTSTKGTGGKFGSSHAWLLKVPFVALLVLFAFKIMRDMWTSSTSVSKRGIFIVIGALFVLLIGTMMYFDKVDLITAIYVAMQVITTIGYGDIVPQSWQTRLMWSFLVIIFLIVIAYVFTGFMDRAADMQQDALSQIVARAPFVSEAMQGLAVATLEFVLAIAFGTVFYATWENCACSYGRTVVAECDMTTYETCVATGGFVKTWVDSFYFSVITLTTVGFGDFTPVTKFGRTVGVFWMIMGVAATAKWIGAVSTALFASIADGGTAKEHKEQKPHDIVFDMFDSDGSGTLSRAEYHMYYLVKNHLVSTKMLDKLDKSFHEVANGKEASRDAVEAQSQSQRQVLANIRRASTSGLREH
mmetsp:Transcript_125384/g.315938  ORF Transcript_125384/g.315938 Transcript_125384/m.315938 type:complete len:458 (-) Transcript_125384:83-1456(-)